VKRYYGTIEYVTNRRAIVALTDAQGGWQGAQRVDLPRAKNGRRALYEWGYATASTMAAIKGGELDAFRVSKK
jgi:hypothetical protein